MMRPEAGQRYETTMQHHDPVGTPEGEAGAALKSRLTAAENVLATLMVDLDGELRFGNGLLALTDSRVLARDPDGSWREWPLSDTGQALHLTDHAGIGTLDFLDDQRLLARWRYTLAHQAAALRLLKLFDQRVASVAQVAAAAAEAAELDDIAAGETEAQKTPSTWVLLRLGRFIVVDRPCRVR